MTHPRNRTRSAALVAALVGVAFFGQLSGIAQAVPPVGNFLNPDVDDGPGNEISDLNDGTDGLYHFVLRAADPSADGHTIASVQIQIEDGDADAAFENIGAATQVGATNIWELKWDQSAHTPAADVNADAGQVQAFVTDSGGETATIGPFAVVFNNSTDETVEITQPTNGGNLGFFNRDGDPALEAQISGTASDGNIDAAGEVELFYTKAPLGTANPAWIDCDPGGITVAVTPDPALGPFSTWTGECELQGGDTPDLVTAVAARADDADAGEAGNESGDAHGVSGFTQVVSTADISPTTDTGSTGFCNTFTLKVRDQQGGDIVGANVDVHAQGPDDQIQFAMNNDEGAVANPPDTVSDFHKTPSAATTHTFGNSAACDELDQNDFNREDDADAVADNLSFDDVNTASPAGDPAADLQFHEGIHVDPGGTGTNDIRHIEGTTDFDGFQFSIDSPVNGTTNLTGWADTVTENDVINGAEPQATATKTWGAPVAQNLDATPEDDINTVPNNHPIDVVVTDQNGNPAQGVRVRGRVTAGPHADNDLDGQGGTPLGYFGDCLTLANGRCAAPLSYGGTEAGADTIIMWTNKPEDNKLTGPDTDDPNDEVKKTWVQQPPNACIDFDPNTDTNSANTTHLMTAFVTNGGATPATSFSTAGDNADAAGQVDNDCAGALLQGVAVTFQITDDTPDAGLTPDNNTAQGGADTAPTADADLGREDSETILTNASGVATTTLDNLTDLPGDGQNAVDATVQGVPGPGVVAARGNDSSPGNGEKVLKNWVVAGAGVTLECAPNDDLNAVGDSTSYTATLLDIDANPVAGQPVDMEVFEGPHAGDDLDGNAASPVGHFVDQVLTNASGQVTGSYTGTKVGLDELDCYVDSDGNDAFTGGEVQDQPVPTGGAPVTADTRQWVAAADIQAADVQLDKDPLDNDPEPGSEPGTAFTANNTAGGGPDDCDGPVGVGGFATEGTGPPGGGPDWDNASTHPVNGVHLLCVSAEFTSGPNPGAQLTGAEVTVTVTGVGGVTTDPTGAGAGSSATSRIDVDPAGSAGGTDAPGDYAEFFLVGEDIGTMGVTATVDGVTDTDSGTNTFIVNVSEEREVDCDPEIDTNEPGTDHEILCLVTDGLDNPVAGAPIAWTKTESGGSTSTFQFQQVVTDANGNARASINSPTEGTTDVTATIGGECAAAAGQPETGTTQPPFFGSWDTGKGAGNCTITVKKIWKKTVVVPPPQSCPEVGGYKVDVGTKGDDKLKGDNDCNKLKGKKGDDKLKGRGEDDLLVGGPGFDKCIGGPGDDRFRGCEKIRKGSQAEVV